MSVLQGETIIVIDSDPSARTTLRALVESMGMHVEACVNGEEFFQLHSKPGPGCLVSNLRLRGMSGCELQRRLTNSNVSLPVVFIADDSDIPATVQAMRDGAVAVLQRPYRDQELWDAIQLALRRDAESRRCAAERNEILDRLATLSSEERDVLDLIVAGNLNKVIAQRQGVSVRTVEARRRTVFRKMAANSLADLVRLIVTAECCDRVARYAADPNELRHSW